MGGGTNLSGLGGTLNFHLPLGGLSQMGELNIFHFFSGAIEVFSTGGMGGVPPPLASWGVAQVTDKAQGLRGSAV